ncbi:kinesin-like protein [Trypanosoma brucei equiperdum]|uniref:Kinesin-like protein n=1 Tax=Trypanosoma brucei equiperdum TaxID=630700 RepID=A0A3L6KXP0_9TRYP|nr:kinesin-like protein [Trypanosoma brucei equiperdum]
MLNIVRQLSQVVPKRNSCHTVTLRIVESFQFTDPEQGQAVTMSRRVNVLFALLRNMPLGFQRCVDIAVERDSGENPWGRYQHATRLLRSSSLTYCSTATT